MKICVVVEGKQWRYLNVASMWLVHHLFHSFSGKLSVEGHQWYLPQTQGCLLNHRLTEGRGHSQGFKWDMYTFYGAGQILVIPGEMGDDTAGDDDCDNSVMYSKCIWFSCAFFRGSTTFHFLALTLPSLPSTPKNWKQDVFCVKVNGGEAPYLEGQGEIERS